MVDDDRPEVGGRFRLDAGPDGEAAEGGAGAPARRPRPTWPLAVAELGALLLGGVAWATLRRAGLVDEHTPGAVRRADALFRPERPPWCATDF